MLKKKGNPFLEIGLQFTRYDVPFPLARIDFAKLAINLESRFCNSFDGFRSLFGSELLSSLLSLQGGIRFRVSRWGVSV